MIGKVLERRYQSVADKRNEAIRRLDDNRETARYFERECSKARRFNAWSESWKAIESRHRSTTQKIESLNSRRTKLKDLLQKEEESYARECQRIKIRELPKIKYSYPFLEKRAEDSLYRPMNCRRIQSYFCGSYANNFNKNRPILKDLNERNPEKKTNVIMNEMDFHRETKLETNEEKSSLEMSDHEKFGITTEQKIYVDRNDEYKENLRSARSSNLHGMGINVPEGNDTCQNFKKTNTRAGSGLDSCEHLPRTRTLHDSHFHLGTEENVEKSENMKFRDRYKHKSLDATNVHEQSHDMEQNGDNFDEMHKSSTSEHSKENSSIEQEDTSTDQVDRACEKEETLEHEELIEFEKEEMRQENLSRSIREEAEVAEDFERRLKIKESKEQHRAEEKVEHDETLRLEGVENSLRRSDHRHFETEKSFPWMRISPRDKNLSESMFLYLTHNELKEQIQNLEKRENQARSKHQWDEALRLRDMKNRLELAREKNLYRREDLLLDPEVKKLGLACIMEREKSLKEREEVCTNSSMYSEEAKILWEKWVVEDSKSLMLNAQVQREELMKQLEENWKSLATEDKQRIADSFKDHEIDAALEGVYDRKHFADK